MHLELPAGLRRAGISLMEKARRTDALSLLPELLASQWWDPAKLADLQAQRLQSLLDFCREEVPWYREFLSEHHDRTTETDPLAVLSSLPVMTKKTVRKASSALHSKSFATWQPRPKSTSGSTGVPLNYYLDRPSHSFQWAHLWRGWHQVGYSPGDQYATLSGGSLVPEKVDMKQRVYLLLSGAIHLPSYHLTPDLMARYVSILQQNKVRFLYGYPSSLELFGSFVIARGDRLQPLQAVFTTSESLPPAARQTMSEAFSCPVIDTYGCNDGGIYAFECQEGDGFHVGTESVVVEIVDEAGHNLPEGQVGNIVTTNLVNRAMPLLRYATGDVGALSSIPCRCGRGLVRLVNLQGRERDFILTPAGRKVHGAFFNHFAPFYTATWLDRFQVYQPDREQLILRVMVNREPASEETDELFVALQKGLGEMEYKLEIVPEMVLTRTGKFRVIISDVDCT